MRNVVGPKSQILTICLYCIGRPSHRCDRGGGACEQVADVIGRMYGRTRRPLAAADLHGAIVNIQYIVRGKLAIRAEGNPHQLTGDSPDLALAEACIFDVENLNQGAWLMQVPFTCTRYVCFCRLI